MTKIGIRVRLRTWRPWESNVERREQYRTVGGNGVIVAHLRLGNDDLSFVVANLTSGGAALLIPPYEDPGFVTGQPVSVTFTCAALAAPIEVQARVVHLEDEILFRLCGIAFEVELAPPDIPQDVRGLFNRRRNVRVAPDASDPIHLEVATPQGDWITSARAEAISESGIAFRTPKPARIKTGDLVTSTFHLTTSAQPLRVSLRILRMYEHQGGCVFGAEFDVPSTPDFEDQRLIIVAYVIRRQQLLASALPG